MNMNFDTWLASETRDPYTVIFELCNKVQFAQIIKAPRSDTFDYLYYMYGCRTKRNQDFKYGGIYSKKDALIYDATPELQDVVRFDSQRNDAEGMQSRSEKALIDRFTEGVCRKVEEMVGNDRTRLSITELQNIWTMRSLMDAKEYAAKAKARDLYFQSQDVQMPVYRCSLYYGEIWRLEDELLAYIEDPELAVKKAASSYFEKNQENNRSCTKRPFIKSTEKKTPTT